MALAVRDTLNAVWDAVRTLAAAQEQIADVAGRAVDAGFGEDLEAMADSVAAALDEALNRLTQTRSESGQDPIRFPGMLDNQYVALYENVAGMDEYRQGGPDGRPTAGARERFADLNTEWSEIRAEVQRVLKEELGAFNRELAARAVPAVVVP